MKLRMIAPAVAAAVVLVAGCGGSSGGSGGSGGASGGGGGASAAATTPGANATTAAASTAATTATTASSTVSLRGQDCTHLAAMALQYQHALAPTGGGGVDLGAALRADQALANATPPSIHADAEYVVHAFAGALGALEKAGYKAGTAPTAAQLAAMGSIEQQFNQPQFQTSMHRLSTWVHDNCHGA
ncbi:MAG TPA: hypothetical protein VE992_06865 [Solirubrobacteraceae bacterium]|nr:hypothetical protein [Solirubrobacteraceae bacterium]